MAKRRVYITGGAGRVGQLLQREWAKKMIFDPIFLKRSDWDILTKPAPALTRDDIVLDLAGNVRGDVSANPLLASRVAEWAGAAGAAHFYMSSASVYSGGQGRMSETDALSPSTAYGQSKALAESLARNVYQLTTILRLGNVAGIDALLGGLQPNKRAVLDRVDGQLHGPVRSYIGPKTLALTLSKLFEAAIKGNGMPSVINVAQPPPVSMADLLIASGHEWEYGPERPGVIPRVELSTDRLESICFVPHATAEQLVAEASEARISQ